MKKLSDFANHPNSTIFASAYRVSIVLNRDKIPKIYCGVEQLVARWAHNPKVVGSSPTPATRRNLARKCRVFLFQGVKLAYKPWSKKALKERSDSRFLFVKHHLFASALKSPCQNGIMKSDNGQ